jgi:hypothetical protein
MIIEDGIMAWFDGPEWDEVTLEVFQRLAPQVQQAAQANAIWEDQTGAARAGLVAGSFNDGGIITMALAHSVDYGVWLETIQNGRFAIIMRTLEEHAKMIAEETARAVAAARKGRNL